MTNQMIEQLSEMMDDECACNDLEPVLAHYQRDEEVRGSWHRYHLIRDALKNNLPDQVSMDLAHRVQAMIDAEAPHSNVTSVSQGEVPHLSEERRWGLAIAASVATMVFAGALVFYNLSQTPTSGVQVASNPPVSDQASTAEVGEMADNSSKLPVKGYLVNHNGSFDSYGMRGGLPYARVVSHSTQ